MDPVLVAYATKYGSTQEIAEALAEELRVQGLDTRVSPARDVASLDGYSAVVVGAALYNHKWHGDVTHFLSRHRQQLMGLPVAVFAVGPVNDTPQEFDGAREQLDHVLARRAWLTPASVAVFGGRFDPARLRFPGASHLLAKVPTTDIVDSERVAAWARSLPEALALEQAVAH